MYSLNTGDEDIHCNDQRIKNWQQEQNKLKRITKFTYLIAVHYLASNYFKLAFSSISFLIIIVTISATSQLFVFMKNPEIRDFFLKTYVIIRSFLVMRATDSGRQYQLVVDSRGWY